MQRWVTGAITGLRSPRTGGVRPRRDRDRPMTAHQSKSGRQSRPPSRFWHRFTRLSQTVPFCAKATTHRQPLDGIPRSNRFRGGDHRRSGWTRRFLPTKCAATTAARPAWRPLPVPPGPTSRLQAMNPKGERPPNPKSNTQAYRAGLGIFRCGMWIFFFVAVFFFFFFFGLIQDALPSTCGNNRCRCCDPAESIKERERSLIKFPRRKQGRIAAG